MEEDDERAEDDHASGRSQIHPITQTKYRANDLLFIGKDTEEQRRFLYMMAHTAAAEFEVTGNAVFAWGAIQACLAPDVTPLPLPRSVQRYLHDAAQRIVDAAVGHHKEFPPAVLRALSFAGTQGASHAKEYAKLQSQEYLIGIYEALMQRHGMAEAEKMIGDVVRISPDRVRARLTEARRTRRNV